jgi:hypothetical protein
VRTLSSKAIVIIAMLWIAQSILADPRARDSKNTKKDETVTVFVTGSLIPQRVRVQRVGTNSQSPLRVIDRQEIERSGRQTTARVLITDPSARVIGR